VILRKTIFSIFIYLLFFQTAQANECGKWFDNFNSPVCTDAKYIFWTGTAITGAIYFSKSKISHRFRTASLRKKPIDRYSKIGEIIGWGYLNGTYFFGSLIAGGKKNRKNAEYMAEASTYTLISTLLLKETIQEQRPDGSDEFDSFPSGHTSMAFAFASVVTANHSIFWGGLAHLTAFFIGFSRIQDDRHYLHDVIAGMTLGMSYGWGIYLNHKEYNKPFWFAATPTNDMRGVQLALNYKF
jgi:membrane-associated phospholipid phosphatase